MADQDDMAQFARVEASPAERAVWADEEIRRNDNHSVAVYAIVDGHIDGTILENAVKFVIDETGALRSSFEIAEGNLRKRINRDRRGQALIAVDVSGAIDPGADALAWIERDLADAGTASGESLFTFALLKIAEDKFYWYQRYHHIIIDGRSVGILARRIAEVYAALGEEVPRAPRSSSLYENNGIAQYGAQSVARDQKFWTEYLSGPFYPGWLARKIPLSPSRSEAIAQFDTVFQDRQRMMACSETQGVSPMQIWAAAVGIHFYSLIRRSELQLSLPVANVRKSEQQFPGMTSNVLPLRMVTEPGNRLVDVARSVGATLHQILPHQRYRGEMIRRDNRIMQDGWFGPSINWMNFDGANSFPGCRFSWRVVSLGSVRDFTIAILDCSGEHIHRVFLSDRKATTTVSELRAHSARILRIMEAFLDQPEQLVSECVESLGAEPGVGLENSIYVRRADRGDPGVLYWDDSAESLSRTVSALVLGGYFPNACRYPKIVLNDDFIVCATELEILEERSTSAPGTLLSVGADRWHVSTGTQNVSVGGFISQTGESLDCIRVARTSQLFEGALLPVFSNAEREILAEIGSNAEQHESFWLERLRHVQPLSLPSTVGGQEPQGSRMASNWKFFPFEQYSQAGNHECVIAAWLIYLSRVTADTRLHVGWRARSPFAGPEWTSRLLAAYVPFEIEIDMNLGFGETLQKTVEEIEKVQRHFTYSLDLIARDPELRPSGRYIVPWSVGIEVVEECDGDSPDSASLDEIPLILQVHPSGMFRWSYAPNIVDELEINRSSRAISRLLEEVLEQTNDALPVGDLSLISVIERKLLLEAWNQTPAPSLDGRCIHQMFEEQVRKSPEAVAVVFGGESLSYTQLNRQANRLAHYLIELGVEPDDRIAICADRGVSMLVCLMATLKAGGAYVPLDPAYASERLSQILSDAAPRLLICDKLGREVLVSEATQGLVVVELDAPRPEWSSQPETDPEVAGLTSRHLAYVIYTSGSTGTPKGVMVEHAQITRLFEVTQNSYGFSDQDVWCLFHSFAFDFSVWEIWGALRYGGRLVIVPYEMARSSRDFYRLVCEQQVTVLNQTPSAFRMLMEAEAESSLSDRLRYVIFGGEALDPTILRSWYRRRPESQPLLVNMYGITETTVHVTYRPLASSDTAASASPIGIRLADLRIYLLDNRQQPVPLGAVGEMYVGGAGVARGYLNRPELTTERFLDDPFCDEPGARMYRTGDLARYLPDGNLEFLGRNDQQVKIRGFRIELGEIEARLADHPLVEQAVVIAREDTSGDKRLIAYYTTASDPAGLTAEQLREHLSVLLPEYMVPAAFVHLETLPLTPNGKLDRKALPAPENWVYAAHDYEQPQGETEIALAEIWKELLHLDRVGRNDNFFELGGHSLLAVRLLSRVAQVIGIELQLTDLFSYPTLARLATAITERSSRNDPELLLPITPLRLEEHLPLSYAQQRLWFLSQFEGGSAAYHIPAGLRLRGDLDCMSLRRSLDTIFARHEALRSTFVAVDGHPEVFLLSDKESVPFIQIDLRTATNMERRLEALSREQVDTPFDLSCGPMVRACLVRLGDREHVLILVQHHIVSDGWSLGIFCRELSTLYTAYLNDKPDPLPPLEIQYPDYAAWQRKWLAGKRLEKQVTYWKKTLSDAPPLLEMPTDRPRPPQQSFAGAQLTVRIDAELTKALKALSAKNGATLFMTLLTAWAAVLSRLSGQDDLVIGTPVANRRHVQVENLIGFFVNTLALRIDLSGNPTIEQLLLRVRTATLEAQDHQDLPFEQVVEIINPPRRLDRAPIFQVMLVSQEEPGSLLSIPNLELQVDDLSAYTAKFDLELDISEEGDEVVGTLRYSTLLFDELTMKRHAAYLYTILGCMVADSGQVVGSIDLLSPEERDLLVVTQNETAVPYPKDRCIHQLIEEQARTTPEAIAVVIGDRFLSYAELNRQANCLAHYLIEQGVRPDDRVAVCIDRGLSLIVGLLAVLKAGGAYMPLDPGYPSDRLAYVLADAQPRVLLCDAIGWEILGSGSGNEAVMVDVDNSRPVWSQLSPTNPDVAALTSRHLAYVIYTSGSTGTPKGVMVEHRSLSNHIHWQAQAFSFTAEDIFLQRTAISFDASVWEIWTPLAIGARLILLPSDLQRDPVGIATTIAKNHVTVAQFVPSLLEATLRSRTFQCRYLFCGGEPLSAALVQEAQRYTSEGVVNLYGPTETTIDATCWHFRNQTVPEVIPIGRPIANTRIYLMDSERQLVPLGAVGELYIGGAGVARGYLNRPDLTSERFLPDPFSAETGARIYRTGDLARYLSDGNLEFLGRNDHQVKIRGFRIELGEIEARLAEYPLVEQALVIAREDVPGNKRLVAYYTGDASVTAEQLRTHLAELLPEYMVPAAFAHLDALPLAPNGKLDRKALPAPEGDAYAAHAYEPPQGEAETVLAEIWKELLHVERVGRNDNFFELGGHSLLAVRLQAHVQKRLNLELSLAHIFGSNTLSALAQIIAASRADAVPDDLQTITATPRSAPLPLSFAQQRLWFLSQFENLSASYHIAALLQLDGDLDHSSLQSSLSTIFARHEALRSTFITIGGEPFVKLLPQEKEFILPEYDLREFAAQATRFRALCEEQFRTPFDLATGPMVRACLVHLRDQEHALILVMHHIVSDGWSMGLLVRELSVLYTAYLNGEPNPLPPLEIQYPDYAAWQRHWLTGERLDRQIDYWKKALADAPPLLDLPTDRPRPPQQSFAGAQIPVRIDAELTKALKALSAKHGTTLFMTLLAAWAAVLSRLSGQEDLVIGTPVANRRHIQVENLIGFFVNTLALRIDLSGNPTVEELLHRVRIATLEAQDHQDLPFEQVVEIINPPRRLDHTPIFQVMFAWRNEETNIPQLPRVHASLLDSSYVNSRYGLELDLAEDSGMIVGTLTYASALFDEVTTERQIGYLQVVLQAMVADTRQEVDSINLLSAEERDLLHERWNSTATRYPSNLCIHQLFEEQAAKNPDATAVLWQNGSLTYEELNRRANRLAHHLVELGVRPDDRVAICMDRSPEMVVGLLATLKAGAAYMPLDPAHPPERIVQVLEDAAPRILLCDGAGQKALEGKATRNILLLNLDSAPPAWSHQPEVDPHVSSLTSRHLAYVIYTSGSTGTPKGVMNEHRGVVNRLVWMQETYKLRPDDVVLQKTSFSFDVSVWEFFWTLMTGATLALAPPGAQADPDRLIELICEWNVSIVHFVPSLLDIFIHTPNVGRCTSLRQLICSGEALQAVQLKACLEQLPAMQVDNLYGPTEAAIDVTAWACPPEFDSIIVPIGRPIANMAIYLLDHRQQPVPLGAVGEMYIGGVGVARGYLNRPELTAERFLADPFCNDAGARMYRTGDLARYLPDGNLEFLGRNDQQVKLRGFRIELGEIEAQLVEYPHLEQAVVVAREEKPGDKRLVAYYSGAESLSAERLRNHLASKLPEYMVPSAFVRLDALPLTPNGKIDRKALPAPEGDAYATRVYEPPQGETETAVAEIWKELLHTDRIGRNDNFFELGGHSLLAVRLLSRLQARFELKIDLSTLFENPQLAPFSKRVLIASIDQEFHSTDFRDLLPKDC